MEGQAKVATEFLIYAYFKLDVQADEKEIIGKVVERAYADATNEGAYNTRLYDDMQDPTKEDKQNRKTVSDGVRALGAADAHPPQASPGAGCVAAALAIPI